MIKESADSRVGLAISQFRSATGLSDVLYEVIDRAGTTVLQIALAHPSSRFYKAIDDIQRSLDSTNQSGDSNFIIRVSRSRSEDILRSPEVKLFLRTIASNLNANQHSFNEDQGQYIRSVFGAEEQIEASGNHVVFGRRGAGKSSLLAYSFNSRSRRQKQSVWLDMQTYSQRADDAVILDVISDIFERTQSILPNPVIAKALTDFANKGGADEVTLRKLLPRVRRYFAEFAESFGDLVFYLDDFHMVDRSMQPALLDYLYAFARGNRVFLKLSAIETLTVTYSQAQLRGMEIPHDIQPIRLDLNLTMPEKASEHIRSILDAIATYSGLPSLDSLTTGPNVLSRLVWTSAGVPRDALSVFSEATGKSTLRGVKRVSVSAVNEAASKTVNGKLLDLERDAHLRSEDLKAVLDRIKAFCLAETKQNAFLVELSVNARVLDAVHELVDLRVLHVINESLNTGKAGRRFQALILDYGFYTGTRAARSVSLFNPEVSANSYDAMRRLPVFKYEFA